MKNQSIDETWVQDMVDEEDSLKGFYYMDAGLQASRLALSSLGGSIDKDL